MTSTSPPLSVRHDRCEPPVVTTASTLVAATVIGLASGALTAFAQGWLPDSFASLANSAGPWTLVAFAAASVASTARVASVAGALTLSALLAGYALGATAQGAHASSSMLVFWGSAAIVVGPVIGLSAHRLRYPGRGSASLAAGALAGVLIGEGIHGLTAIASTTSPWFWSIELVCGAGVLVWTAVRRLRRARSIVVTVAVAALVAAGLAVSFRSGLGLIG